ncbi:MAG: hypothetical protein EPO35_04325 [Acidobacteria bacterium]|nr:MAG: hypothetical protein EPO35_04325 [Acidobacteriota bacterium]
MLSSRSPASISRRPRTRCRPRRGRCRRPPRCDDARLRQSPGCGRRPNRGFRTAPMRRTRRARTGARALMRPRRGRSTRR